MRSIPNFASKARIGPYLFKRFTRIFPAYWPVRLGVLGMYALLPDLSASGGRTFSALSSVLLLPADRPPALSVAWTLVHELMFYVLFMLWFVSRRAFWGGLLVWVAAIVLAQAGSGATGWLRYPLSVLNIEFMIGVLAAVAYRRRMFAQHAGMLIARGKEMGVWVGAPEGAIWAAITRRCRPLRRTCARTAAISRLSSMPASTREYVRRARRPWTYRRLLELIK